MATVTIEVPDDAFKALHRSPQELGREIRLAAAMLWYSQGRISHEKAAQIAGVSRIDLIDALAAARLPAFSLLVSLGSDLVLVSLGSSLWGQTWFSSLWGQTWFLVFSGRDRIGQETKYPV